MSGDSGNIYRHVPQYSSSEAQFHRLSGPEKIKQTLQDIARDGHSKHQPFSIGHVEREIRKFASEHGIEVAKGDLYMSASALGHARRDSKRFKIVAIKPEDLISFPKSRSKMEVYYDTQNKNFVYTDRVNKFIVHPNYIMKIARKKRTKVNFVTASKVTDDSEFSLSKYLRIK